jgi:hypothetical protein
MLYEQRLSEMNRTGSGEAAVTKCWPTAAPRPVAASSSTGARHFSRNFTGMHRYLPALFLTYGHEIVYEPVNDWPRLKGASKYTNLGAH